MTCELYLGEADLGFFNRGLFSRRGDTVRASYGKCCIYCISYKIILQYSFTQELALLSNCL